jgi:hypothetical protein
MEAERRAAAAVRERDERARDLKNAIIARIVLYRRVLHQPAPAAESLLC